MAICPSATASPVLSSGQWGGASRAAVEGAGQRRAGHNFDMRSGRSLASALMKSGGPGRCRQQIPLPSNLQQALCEARGSGDVGNAEAWDPGVKHLVSRGDLLQKRTMDDEQVWTRQAINSYEVT